MSAVNEESDVEDLLLSNEEVQLAELNSPLYTNTRAGRCLTDVLNDMFIEGKLTLDHLTDIPNRFNECMKRIVQRSVSVNVKVNAQLLEFQDLPNSGTWRCSEGEIALPSNCGEIFKTNSLVIKTSP